MPSFTHLLQPTKFFLGFGFGFGLDMEDLNSDTMSSLVEMNTVLGWWQACPITELVWNHRTPLYSSNSVPLLSDTGANQFALHH